jgi:eukaryotic-like serine/threonine-protein kinase
VTEPPTPGQPPLLAGRYALRQRIGSGGAGVVWRAHDRVLDRVVAVKLLHHDLARDDATASRFRAEATAAAKLTHPHAVIVYDIGRDGDRDYLVMEHVEGATLGEVLTAGPLPAGVVASLGEQVARALGAAHARGLVHRDVKPANVLITEDGVAKVADFGIARALGEATSRLTTPGHVMGTARYLAPEQLRDQAIDARADVYALGLVLHQALTGQLPFGEGTAVELASRRLVGSLPRVSEQLADVPTRLDDALARATEREAVDRFTDGAAFAGALAGSVTTDAQSRLAETVGRVLAADVAREPRAAPGDPEAGAAREEGAARTPPRSGERRPAATSGPRDDGRPAPADESAADPAGSGRSASGQRSAAPSEERTSPDRRGAGHTTDATTALPAAAAPAARARDEGDLTDPRGHRQPATARDAGRDAAWASAEPAGALRTAAEPTSRVASDQATEHPGRHRSRRRVFVGAALVGLLLAGGVVALWLVDEDGPFGGDTPDEAEVVLDPFDTDEEPEPEPEEVDADEASTLQIVDGGDHDPFGSGEHPDDVPNAFDGDPSTTWQTQQYFNSPEMGGLKPGVGMWVDLGSSHAVSEITVGTTNPGADLTIYTGDDAPGSGTDPEDWGSAVATIDGAAEQERVGFDDPVEARVVLLWFTSLPADGGGYRTTVSDVSVVGS